MISIELPTRPRKDAEHCQTSGVWWGWAPRPFQILLLSAELSGEFNYLVRLFHYSTTFAEPDTARHHDGNRDTQELEELTVRLRKQRGGDITARGERPEGESPARVETGFWVELRVKGSRVKPPKAAPLELRALEQPA